MKMQNFFFFSLLLFLFGCGSTQKICNYSESVSGITDKYVLLESGRKISIPRNKNNAATLLILVRHAEKAGGSNPPLTELGQRRAEKLAVMLTGLSLDKVFSTNFERTIQTARPVSEQKKLDIHHYNPRDLEGFVSQVLQEDVGKAILVTGHSNTTPTLVNLFLGEQVYAQIDEGDYNNLFLLLVNEKGDAKVMGLKFTVE